MPRLLPMLATALFLSLPSAGATAGLFGDSDSKNDAAAQTDAAPKPEQPFDLPAQIANAQKLRQAGKLADAVRALSQLMLVAPDDPGVVSEYGKALVEQGEAKDAIAFLKRATQLSPNDWTLYSAMGVAYDEMGDAADAERAYQHALTLSPGEASVLNNYALSRHLAGDDVAARKLIAEAAVRDGMNFQIAKNVAAFGSAPRAPAVPANASTASIAPVSKSTLPAVAQTQTRPVTTGPAATGAPRALTVVMQTVPKDPLAGPVAHAAAKHPRIIKAAAHVAPKKAKTPSLRMSADAT